VTAEQYPPIGEKEISEILDILSGSGWKDVYLKSGDFELRLSDSTLTSGAVMPSTVPSVAPTPESPPAPAPAAEAAPGAHAAAVAPAPAGVEESAAIPSHRAVEVTARSIGVFWRSPQPGTPPFVEVGDLIEADSPLAILEVMKMMTRVTAGVAGRVAAIHVGNGEMVESGDLLITVERADA